ncbi:Cof-type HAD-IIB family hydrolase [Anaerobacillus sp. MEB173]|uniref:Cof-type HAD-IIB family hydrolase n=1 Tax=Anaerobacillus sp. MEB173 TaxID=3383345 RepID=UPI003F93B510
MQKQHLIVLDLDGTLLRNEKTISNRSKLALAKAREQGHLIMIATGRPYRASKMYYEELGLTTPIVNFNGAFVHHPLHKDFGTFHSPMDLRTAKTIIETCEAFRVQNIMVEIIDDFYLRYHDEVIINTFNMGQSPVDYGNLHLILDENPTSILVHPHDHHLHDLRQLLKESHAEVVDQRVWAAPWNMIEIVRSGLNKAVGIQKVANYYSIPKERIIAFGDEDNDLEMIEYAGLGVAMGNAIPELKNIANTTTKSNEEDGIAIFLEDIFNLK